MNYMAFDSYLVHQRNEEMQREVHSLRLEKQLWQEHGSSA